MNTTYERGTWIERANRLWELRSRHPYALFHEALSHIPPEIEKPTVVFHINPNRSFVYTSEFEPPEDHPERPTVCVYSDGELIWSGQQESLISETIQVLFPEGERDKTVRPEWEPPGGADPIC